MLVHHGPQPYAVAASEAARHARAKLEALIERGRARAASVIDHVQKSQPRDRLVRAGALRFASVDTSKPAINGQVKTGQWRRPRQSDFYLAASS